MAHFFANFRNFHFNKAVHRPVACRPTNIEHEVTQHVVSVNTVANFWVELYAVNATFLVFKSRKWRVRVRSRHAEAFRNRSNTVAVAHEYLFLFS